MRLQCFLLLFFVVFFKRKKSFLDFNCIETKVREQDIKLVPFKASRSLSIFITGSKIIWIKKVFKVFMKSWHFDVMKRNV